MNSLSPWLTHAVALLDRRCLEAALHCFNIAERKGADRDRCAAGRWECWMLLGNFEEAWLESDAIRRRGGCDPHRFWQGESIRGKRVIVRCLHGFGDSVQFLRYMPALRRVAARVVVEVAPRFVELARCISGVDEVIPWGEHAPTSAPEWDVQIEVTELPYLFRTRVGDLPINTDYIRIPDDALRSAAQVFARDGGAHVGLVWFSGEWNVSRAMPIDLLKPIVVDRSCTFWNVQGGTARGEWASLGGGSNLADAPEFCADRGLLPLAAFLSHLDLVITVDTLAAHLAAALGKRTWVMLQHAADWRWMVKRDDSPWYPSMRLFRQEQQGDWHSVVENVTHALAEWHGAQPNGRMTVPDRKLARPWDEYDAYLFDIDGTLVHCTDAVHYFAFCDALSGFAGRPLNLDGVTAHGNTDIGILRDAFAHAGVPESQWRPHLQLICDSMCAFVGRRQDELCVSTLPAVEDTLRHLRGKGAVVGLATGNLEGIGKLKLSAAGLLDYFHFGAWSDGLENRADVFSRAVVRAQELAGTHATMLVVGDTPSDVRAARANNLAVVAVATGIYSFDQLKAECPDLCIHSLEELAVCA